MNMRSKFLPVATACALLACVSAFAQDYPVANKTITFVLPYAAGGPTDKAARDLAQAMSKAMGGHSIVIDNSAGASGSIGANKVAKAGADGYTLLFTHIAQATLPTFFRNLPYNVEKDFEYIGLVSENPMNLIGRPSLPANNMTELVSWINANKGNINLANAGLGAASHLCGLLFMSSIGIDLTTVPYKGTAPAMSDLLGGQVDLLCDQTSNTVGQIKAGKVRAIGVTSPKRLTQLPDVPTLAEQGLSGFELNVWHGLYAPRGTPRPVLERLNKALNATITDASFNARIAEFGAVSVAPALATPEGLRTHLAKEIALWGPIIAKAGQFAD
jgi:tripartite-type tricarboxylate transporter receptor subunit TctC